MTTQELRQLIYIVSFHHDSDGCAIKYIFNGAVNNLIINSFALRDYLEKIGSIEEDIEPESWEDYSISQWDALSIVIRSEYEKIVDKDVNDSDLFSALNKLLNPHK